MPLSLTAHPVATMDAFVAGQQRGANQLLAVGSDLYYVAKSQVNAAGAGGAGGHTQIYKSSDKLTWVLVATYPYGSEPPSIPTDNTQDAPCCRVGSIIYIVAISQDSTGFPPVNRLVLHRFDTATDTFVSNSALGPLQGGAGFSNFSVSPFNNGTLLVTSTTTALFGPVGAPQFQLQIYTPASDTWGASSTVFSDGSTVLKQMHDPTSDLAFCFYGKNQETGPEVRCLTVTDVLTFTDVTVFTNSFALQKSQPGLPCIATATNEIVFPYKFSPPVGAKVLRVARSPVQATPVFSNDLVEDCSTLPLNSTLQQYDLIAGPGWMAEEIGGLLYVFYDIDNGDLDDPTSQSWLYYRSSTGPGVWSTPNIAYTSVIPGEQLTPYGTAIPGFDPVILVGVIDPTLWPDISSLTDFILYSAAAPLAASCNNPPNGTVGVAYTHNFGASGGTAPYTFSLSSGALPNGLTLASDGSVSGTPSLAGTFPFTVQVVDSVASGPIAIDTVNAAESRGAGFGALPPYGPFSALGKLFHLLWIPGVAIEMCKSVDGGATWSICDAAHNPPTTLAGAPAYRTGNTITVIVPDGAGSILLFDFDLTTETWAASYTGVNAPINIDAGFLFAFFLRSTGTRIFIYRSTADTFLHGAELSVGNVWSAEFPVQTNLPDITSDAYAVLDANDVVHLFWTSGLFAPFVQQYQAVLADNSLGSFYTFPTPFTGKPYWGIPVVVANVIVAPTVFKTTGGTPGSVWVGTPLAAPVWSESGNIFPNAQAAGLTSMQSIPAFLMYDGTHLYCAKVLGDPAIPTTADRIAVSVASNALNPLAPWNDAIFFQSLPAQPIYDAMVYGVQIGTTAVLLSVDGDPTTETNTFFSAAATATVNCSITINAHGPAFVAGGGPGGGGPGGGGAGGGGAGGGGAGGGASGSGGPGGVASAYRPPMCERCCPPLLAELVPWQRPKRALEMDAPPCGSKHMAAAASIAAPATNAQTQIVQYQVPNGFRFKLKGVLLNCNCPGWTPGDGNAVFSVTLNKPLGSAAAQGTPLRGLSSVLVPLGSFAQGPWPVSDGEHPVFESRDVVRVLVSSNPLVIAPGLPNVFTAMLVGHIWPLTSQAVG